MSARADRDRRLVVRLRELIAAAVSAPERFILTITTLCELAGLAVLGRTSRPGELRIEDNEIIGSRHQTPPSADVPRLVDELCTYVNTSPRDAIHLAAYVMWRVNWIHPFDEGNGRTARAASYLVLCAKLGRDLPGESTLVERCVAQKRRYIKCLEAADAAWAQGQLDVALMEAFLEELLGAQLQDHLQRPT